MFTFRTTTYAFFAALILLNILHIFITGVSIWHYLILVVVYLAISVTFSFFIRTNYHMKSYSSGETTDKIVALTFDDGPDVEFTPGILDILKTHEVNATFFCVGRKMEGNESLLKRMDVEGHLIGMHSFSHSNWFDFFTPGRMKDEFFHTEKKIREITGKRPLLFRPPYGVINPMVKKALSGTGYHVIGFSNRALDTVSKNEKKILSKLITQLKPGDVILLHDTIQQNMTVVPELINYLNTHGYRIVSLSQLLKIEPYDN